MRSSSIDSNHSFNFTNPDIHHITRTSRYITALERVASTSCISYNIHYNLYLIAVSVLCTHNTFSLQLWLTRHHWQSMQIDIIACHSFFLPILSLSNFLKHLYRRFISGGFKWANTMAFLVFSSASGTETLLPILKVEMQCHKIPFRFSSAVLCWCCVHELTSIAVN